MAKAGSVIREETQRRPVVAVSGIEKVLEVGEVGETGEIGEDGKDIVLRSAGGWEANWRRIS